MRTISDLPYFDAASLEAQPTNTTIECIKPYGNILFCKSLHGGYFGSKRKRTAKGWDTTPLPRMRSSAVLAAVNAAIREGNCRMKIPTKEV